MVRIKVRVRVRIKVRVRVWVRVWVRVSYLRPQHELGVFPADPVD